MGYGILITGNFAFLVPTCEFCPRFMSRKTVTTLKWHPSGWRTPVDSCTVWNNTAVTRWEYKWNKRVDGWLGHCPQSFLFLLRHLWPRTQSNRTNTAWRTLTWRSTDRCWATFPSRSISSSSRWLKESYSPWSVSSTGQFHSSANSRPLVITIISSCINHNTVILTGSLRIDTCTTNTERNENC